MHALLISDADRSLHFIFTISAHDKSIFHQENVYWCAVPASYGEEESARRWVISDEWDATRCVVTLMESASLHSS